MLLHATGVFVCHMTMFLHALVCHLCFVTHLAAPTTYTRCPSYMPGYNYYCYVMLAEMSYNYDATATCGRFGLGAEPIWFSDQAEVDWLHSVIQEQSINCMHIG